MNKAQAYNSIIGFMVGDAMGATTEFMYPEEIKAQYNVVTDIIGGGWLNLQPGETTDDTEMMICIIKAINKIGIEDKDKLREEITNNFIQWFLSRPKDVGTKTRTAIIEHFSGKEVKEDDMALGNGGLMRALPFALLDEIELNIMQCEITHKNRIQKEYISKYTGFIQDIANNRYIPTQEANRIEPRGNIIDTYESVKYHYNLNREFRHTMILSINKGGDADTIGALLGGAMAINKRIPTDWQRKVINKIDRQSHEAIIEFVNKYFTGE